MTHLYLSKKRCRSACTRLDVSKNHAMILLVVMMMCCNAVEAWTRSGSVSHRLVQRIEVLSSRSLLWSSGRKEASSSTHHMISSGFSFEDGEQILVSVQKPMGIVLEQDSETTDGEIVVTKLEASGSAARAGVQVGDVLVAVQNASTVSVDLDEVLDFIATKCPRVVNLRFQRIRTK